MISIKETRKMFRGLSSSMKFGICGKRTGYTHEEPAAAGKKTWSENVEGFAEALFGFFSGSKQFRVFFSASLAFFVLTGVFLFGPVITGRRTQRVLAPDQYEVYLKQALYGSADGSGKDSPWRREQSIDYYARVTGDREIAAIIYDEAVKHGIEASLAFSLVFSESRFDPRAVNVNRDSVDRGLFQLNSKSFPRLKPGDFFKPEVNVPLGMEYLRYCLDAGGNEVAALAMYNAGPTRVKDSRTPKMTLDYIHKIQNYKVSLEKGVIPGDFSNNYPVPLVKSVKNVALLMEQKEDMN